MALTELIEQRPAPLGAQRIQQTISRLEALPAFYPTVQKALRLLEDPNSNNGQIQQVISSDQAVASRVLKLANSAYFGFYSQVRTISLAVALMGREKISTLLRRFLAEELMGVLTGHKHSAGQIHQLSLATATAAHMLAVRLSASDKEEIFLAGLLHNIGELVLLSQFRSSYEEFLRLTDRMPRSEAERAAFGVEAPMVGKWLLEAWNFPRFFADVVERYRHPWLVSFRGPPTAPVLLVHAAQKLAGAWSADVQSSVLPRLLSSQLLGALEVDRQSLLEVYQRLPEEVEQAKRLAR